MCVCVCVCVMRAVAAGCAGFLMSGLSMLLLMVNLFIGSYLTFQVGGVTTAGGGAMCCV